MDGIHDLGGRQGYGKIDVTESEVQFHADYEARIRCIAHTITRAPDWSVDWFRHCRELINPIDYLTRPYFDQWAQAYSAMLINSGWATVDEISSGKAANLVKDLPAPVSGDQARQQILKENLFDSEVKEKPLYSKSDQVRTITSVTNGHTRLPLYARGKSGQVIAHHGAHIYPDAMAVNEKRYVHLYTVEFYLEQLWPEAVQSADTVTLDLWECYLEKP